MARLLICCLIAALMPLPAGAQEVSPAAREAAALRELEAARLKREEADSKVKAAERAVKDAEAQREAGKEPLPGERIGTADGASRLTDGYWTRQKKLENDVENARRNLDQSRSGK